MNAATSIARKQSVIDYYEERNKRFAGYLKITIDATKSCQLRCRYCYFGVKSCEKADVEKIVKAVQNIIEATDEKLNRISVSYMGGEPTLAWPKIKQINKRLRAILSKQEITYSWGMTSNLVDFNRKKADYLISEKAGVLCSIDGPSDIHNKNRPFVNKKENSFQRVVKNVPLAIETKKGDRSRVTVCPEDSNRILEIAETVFGLGFKDMIILPNVHVKWSNKQVKSWGRGIAETIKKFDNGETKISTIITRDGEGFDMALGVRSCGIGKNIFALSTNGILFPCHRLTQQPEFSTIDASVAKSSEIRMVLQSMLKTFDVNTIPKCIPCKARFRCGGGCLADNAVINGNPRIPISTLCRLKKEILVFLEELGVKYEKKTRVTSSCWFFACGHDNDDPDPCDHCCDSGCYNECHD